MGHVSAFSCVSVPSFESSCAFLQLSISCQELATPESVCYDENAWEELSVRGGCKQMDSKRLQKEWKDAVACHF